MWVSNDRRDVDVVENDFVDFKNKCPEHNENLIQKIECEKYNFSPLVEGIDRDYLINSLSKFSPWGYSFNITDNLSAYDVDRFNFPHLPIVDFGLSEMELRLSILHQIFNEFYLPGDKWIDVATNCGIIPLLISKGRKMDIEAMDLAQINIDKAILLQSICRSDQEILFNQGDVYEYFEKNKLVKYDIISALGLFYHLSDPIGLMQKLFDASRRIVIVDTIVHNFQFSGWIQTISRHVKFKQLGHANDTRKIVELHPTYRGLIDTMFQVGFKNVIEFVPSSNLLLSSPADIYKNRNRVMLVAIK